MTEGGGRGTTKGPNKLEGRWMCSPPWLWQWFHERTQAKLLKSHTQNTCSLIHLNNADLNKSKCFSLPLHTEVTWSTWKWSLGWGEVGLPETSAPRVHKAPHADCNTSSSEVRVLWPRGSLCPECGWHNTAGDHTWHSKDGHSPHSHFPNCMSSNVLQASPPAQGTI